ncbi:unnamed protein product [Gulo gulo]|uniref:Uncharacterized protein n=1 Tax=Gulo gulo TaxID=48420 RepID=A0A9X9LUG3_GULGU|nr:unnamed protein product [Gulo gulo]
MPIGQPREGQLLAGDSDTDIYVHELLESPQQAGGTESSSPFLLKGGSVGRMWTRVCPAPAS